MMNVCDWVLQRVRGEVIELPQYTIATQLAKYDAVGTGLGFVLLISLITSDENDPPQATGTEIISLPVVKIRSEWMTPGDGNVADILSGVVRMVAPNGTT